MDFIYNHGETEGSGSTFIRFEENEAEKQARLIELLPSSGLDYHEGSLPNVVLAGIVQRRYVFRLLRGEPFERHFNPDLSKQSIETVPPNEFVA